VQLHDESFRLVDHQQVVEGGRDDRGSTAPKVIAVWDGRRQHARECSLQCVRCWSDVVGRKRVPEPPLEVLDLKLERRHEAAVRADIGGFHRAEVLQIALRQLAELSATVAEPTAQRVESRRVDACGVVGGRTPRRRKFLLELGKREQDLV
jgi:hypothetical protein